MVSQARVVQFCRLLQAELCDQFRANIDAQSSASGQPFEAPWHDTAVFPGGELSDRAGKPVLRDTDAMYLSLRPGPIERRGNKLRCWIVGSDHALKQHRGFVSTENVPRGTLIPRTQSGRARARVGVLSGINRSDRIVVRGATVVPGRPFLSLTRVAVDRAIARSQGK